MGVNNSITACAITSLPEIREIVYNIPGMSSRKEYCMVHNLKVIFGEWLHIL